MASCSSKLILLVYKVYCWMLLSPRNQSERVRNEAIRLIREREDKTVMTQRDADRRIGERLHDEVFFFTLRFPKWAQLQDN